MTLTDTVTQTVTDSGMNLRRQRREPAAIDASPDHVPAPVAVARRQTTATPTAIPHYLVACKSAAAYASACSCIGVRPTTATAAAPPKSTLTTSSKVSAGLPVEQGVPVLA